MNRPAKWIVQPNQQGIKLLPFLQSVLATDKSARFLKRALESNVCRINGRIERFASKPLLKGDLIELAKNWDVEPPSQKVQLLYEDEWLKVIDKPMGLICDPSHFEQALVHRLDKDTTGLLMIAKTRAFLDLLIPLFSERKIEKTYLALVDGIPHQVGGLIESRLGKKGAFAGQVLYGSVRNGQYAATHWKQLRQGKTCSLLSCQPITGRTHQIRVHMKEMGHPILVDRQYAEKYRTRLFIRRPLLHASRLQFIHPMTQEKIDLESPLPADFVSTLKSLNLSE